MKNFFNFIDKLPYLIREIVYLLLVSLDYLKILRIFGFTGCIYISEYGIDLDTTELNLIKLKLKELTVDSLKGILTNPKFTGDTLGVKYLLIFNDKGQVVAQGTWEVTLNMLYKLNTIDNDILLHELTMIKNEIIDQCNVYVETKPWWWKLNGGGFFYMHISDKNIFHILN